MPTLSLDPTMFDTSPREVFARGDLMVSAFRFGSGVEALRIDNGVGYVVVLPFVGQQVWRAHLHGRELSMVTQFDEPVDAATYTDYDAGNGAYLIHCGGTAMGIPGPGDTHPLHGQMPFARHRNVELVADDLAVTVRGGFTLPAISAITSLTITAGSGILDSTVRLTNTGDVTSPLMYLAHANFRPARGGHLIETLEPGRHIISRMDFELDGEPFESRLLDSGSVPMHRLLEPHARVEPQLIQEVPVARTDGTVTTRMRHTDGTSDVVTHRCPELTHSVRWIKRTAVDDAFAFAMPATATPGGFTAENARGNVRFYEPGESLVVAYRHGAELT